jgi:hypothetical protein
LDEERVAKGYHGLSDNERRLSRLKSKLTMTVKNNRRPSSININGDFSPKGIVPLPDSVANFSSKMGAAFKSKFAPQPPSKTTTTPK